MKTITVLGSTGSVGRQVMDILKKYGTQFQVKGLAAKNESEELSLQIEEFKPKAVCLDDEIAAREINKKFSGIRVEQGASGLINLVKDKKTDIVVFSMSGTAALSPLLEAIRQRKIILIANKESIIVAGEIIARELIKYNVGLIPLDSEHSAIFECLKGEKIEEVENLILTCSGGPFRNYSQEELGGVAKEKVLNHPVWKMGPKITVDSATLMNKGFEVIEAHYLFKIPIEKIKVVIHPECIVHSLVEFKDGSIKALLAAPDMRIPIQSALFYPQRAPSPIKTIDLKDVKNLSFSEPDTSKFPCLSLAYKAAELGGTGPAALVFSDEIVVAKFLKGEVKFLDIPKIIERALDSHRLIANPSIEETLGVEREMLEKINEIL
ncbi:MAG: 1-deoxy-D-xylulose-5-phosphate reductoisomerase [bacterium]|nr:1-deoxy-D-xylulose-5-phosphate reductoisomerase [bacterium]